MIFAHWYPIHFQSSLQSITVCYHKREEFWGDFFHGNKFTYRMMILAPQDAKDKIKLVFCCCPHYAINAIITRQINWITKMFIYMVVKLFSILKTFIMWLYLLYVGKYWIYISIIVEVCKNIKDILLETNIKHKFLTKHA
jgi:hypothetical protein